jgi:hypothetical protein
MNEPHDDTEEGKTPDSSGQSRSSLATSEDIEKYFGSGGLLIGSLYRPKSLPKSFYADAEEDDESAPVAEPVDGDEPPDDDS